MMSRAGAFRLVAALVTVIWVCLELWAVGPVMRESDQAALLEGSVQLALRDESPAENDSYNYDKQFLSYWVVAAWLRVRGSVEADTEVLTRDGNLLAVALFSIALIGLVATQRRWSLIQVVILACALFCPVIAFSGMFLSPNMISAAFLLAWAALLRDVPRRDDLTGGKASVGRTLLVGITAWAATAARQDAILLMPLLLLLSNSSLPVREWFRDRLIVAAGMGCVFAIVLGYAMSTSHALMPKPFFVPPTFFTYMVGGLGAPLVLLVLFALWMAFQRSWTSLAIAGAVLLPLLFYACVLYTPRHLFLAAMALLLTIFFPAGLDIWKRLVVARTGRALVVLVVIGSILPWIVGVRMSGWKTGRPVLAHATLYPSTDGFWPLGAYGWYFGRLANGDKRPVDHNQRVWAAWSTVKDADLPAGQGAVLSSGLKSFGTFHLAKFGKE